MLFEEQEEWHIIDDEQPAKRHKNKESIEINNRANSRPMFDASSKWEQNQTLSLVLSFRIHDQFVSKDHSQSMKMPTFTLPSLTLSLTRKPCNTPSEAPYFLSNAHHPTVTSTHEGISHFLDILTPATLSTSFSDSPTPCVRTTEASNDYISHWLASQSTADEMTALPEIKTEIDRDDSFTIDKQDSIPLSAKQLETLQKRKCRDQLRREIIILAKKAIKPFYQTRHISKDDYKSIMKKVVTKSTYSNRVDREWIQKRIHSYVRKYRAGQRE